MFKKFLIVISIAVVLLTVAIWIIYANRAKIADKVINYTVQRIVGNSEEGESSDWVSALLSSGSKSIKSALLEEFTRKSPTQNTGEKSVKRKQGLATMADMLTNGTNGNTNDMGQVAQVLLSNLGGMITGDSADSTAVNDVNARDNKGRTLLMNVCRVDVTDKVIKMLLRYGADINAVDNNGRNALMYAVALNEDAKVVAVLLQNGADYTAKDNKGRTVLDYAKKSEIRSLINSYRNQ